MVRKIAHAQLHMYTNIIYKCQSSTCKTVGEKLRTKLSPRTDGRTEKQTDMKIAYEQLHIPTSLCVNFRGDLTKM